MDKKIEKKKWPPKKIASVLGGGVLVVIILYTFVLGDQSTKLNVQKERITISEVKRGPFQEFIPVTGTVQPIETFYLDVQQGGRVVEKYVEEGAFLEIGDPIIRLENPDLTLNIIYNEAQVFQQVNALRSTKFNFEQNRLRLKSSLLDLELDIMEKHRDYKIKKELFDKDLISKTEFEISRDQYDFAKRRKNLTYENYIQDSLFQASQINNLESQVAQLQENLKVTKQQLENLTVRAPIKGQLTSLNGEIGESIAQGQNLGQIDNIESYKVRAAIDEHYIARVSPNQNGTFTFANNSHALNIKTVFPEVTNGRFEVDMFFPSNNAPSGIRRGQTVHIKLELGESQEALLVDRGGFYQTTGGQWIFVINESETEAVRRPIRLGSQNPQVFEVLDGLQPGEKVVTSSYDNYGDIEKLVLKN